MANHTIFLLHGMGKYGKVDDKGVYKPDTEGWFAEAKATLSAIYDEHIKDRLGDKVAFDTQFKIVPINYDSVFDLYRYAWAKQAESWGKLSEAWAGLGLPGAWLDRTGKFLSGAGKDDFGWTHAADVLLYSVRLIREDVKSNVILQISSELEKNPSSWSIMAHSLGTAVLHDTIGGIVARLGPKVQALTAPRVVCAVANVARALTDNDNDAYADWLAPSSEGFRPRSYINLNHELDLIARFDPFQPKVGQWLNNGAYRNRSKLSEYYPDPKLLDWKGVELTDAVARILPHGFTHYMNQPQAAAILWPLLLDSSPGAHYDAIYNSVREANEKKKDKAIKEALKRRIDEHLEDVSPEQEKILKVVVPEIIRWVEGAL